MEGLIILINLLYYTEGHGQSHLLAKYLVQDICEVSQNINKINDGYKCTHI